jgi:hypothetical protein
MTSDAPPGSKWLRRWFGRPPRVSECTGQLGSLRRCPTPHQRTEFLRWSSWYRPYSCLEMDKTYIVDRIEDRVWAILEDGDGPTITIPRAWLPQRAREGDVVRLSTETVSDNERVLRFVLDSEERERRIGEITALRDRLTRGPSGDISL